MSVITTEAVVLHVFDYLETSRVLRLATRDAGVLAVIARGARRSARRFGAALDLFAAGVAEIHIRSGRDLQQLTAFEVSAPREALASDLDRFGSASMLAELAVRCTAGDDQGDIFEALSAGLDGLLHRRGAEALVFGMSAAWQLTASLGFAPAVDHCVSCHAQVPEHLPTQFGCEVGGVLCARCGAGSPGARVLPPDARDVLRRWLAGDAIHVDDPPSRRAHARLLREFIVHHVSEGQELRAFAAWSRRFAAAPAAGITAA